MKKFFKTIGWALSWPFVFIALGFNLLSIYRKARKFKKNPKDLFLEERLKSVYKLFRKVVYLKRIEIVAEDFDKLPEKPLLITPNHKGMFDPIAIFIAMFESGHMGLTTFVAKAELYKRKPVRKVMELLGGIFMQRDNGRSVYEAYLTQSQRIKDGYSVVVFPEGTRIKSDEFGEFQPTTLKVGMENYIAIEPIAIYGTINTKSKSKNGKHRIYLKALKPIQPNQYINTKPEYLMSTIKNDIKKEYDNLKIKATFEDKK